MKTQVWYHGNCPDGHGAAFAANLVLGNSAVYQPVSYGQPPPGLLKKESPEEVSQLYIVDFSYPRETLINLSQQVDTLVLLDHHATAQKDLDGLENVIRRNLDRTCIIKFDMAKSGAVLAWEHFLPSFPVPEFFRYLQDRDLWKFELPDSREISMALRSWPMNFDIWHIISGIRIPGDEILERDCMMDLARQGIACRRLTEQQVAIMAKNHRWAYIDTKNKSVGFENTFNPGGSGEPTVAPEVFILPAANATVFFSEVGEKLLEMHPGHEAAAYWFDRADGQRQWGIRSRPGFDAATAIAKPMGGGGHPQACGFTQKL